MSNDTKVLIGIGAIILALILIFTGFGFFGTVKTGYRGVRTSFNAVTGTVEPGLYFKVPFIQKVVKMDTQTQTVSYEREEPLFSASKDLQDVEIATVVNYHITPESVVDIFKQYRSTDRYEEQVIRPIVRDVVKSVASQYTAEELVVKRSEYNDKVFKSLSDILQPKNVVVERVNITNFKFSESFTQSIEAKVTAEQDALAAKNKLEQVKFEADQRVAQAQAEAEAIKIQAQAINSQGGADYVNLKAIEKWNGQLPVEMIPGSTVPFIQLNR